MMRISRKTANRVCTLIVLIALGAVMGCGLKGPPLPPLTDGNVLAAPTDLAYTLNGNNAVLSWNHSVDPENARIKPKAFTVFLATKSVDGCEGCPFIYKEVGTAAMPDMQFVYPLEKDLHHYFRLQAVGDNEIKSRFSTTLKVESQ